MNALTDTHIETFWRDGVVCLRGVMPESWLDRMAAPLEEALTSGATANLSQMADDLAAGIYGNLLLQAAVRFAPGLMGTA